MYSTVYIYVCTSASVPYATSAKGTSPTRSPVFRERKDSPSARVHAPLNGVDHQESRFGAPVQGDGVVAEVRTIVHVDAQMARISLWLFLI